MNYTKAYLSDSKTFFTTLVLNKLVALLYLNSFTPWGVLDGKNQYTREFVRECRSRSNLNCCAGMERWLIMLSSICLVSWELDRRKGVFLSLTRAIGGGITTALAKVPY